MIRVFLSCASVLYLCGCGGGSESVQVEPAEKTAGLPDGPLFFGLTVTNQLPKEPRRITVPTGAPFEVTGTVWSTKAFTGKVLVVVRLYRPNGRSSTISRGEASVTPSTDNPNLHKFTYSVKSQKRPGECVVQISVNRTEVVDEATFFIADAPSA